MSLVSFLYRYLFRGIGLVLLIGMLTILILAIRSQLDQSAPSRPHAPAAERRHAANERRSQ
jgi:hypothetical protein